MSMISDLWTGNTKNGRNILRPKFFLVEKIFGQKIDVFMESIGQTIPEYLVDFKFFRYYMEQNGFKLISAPKSL